MVWAANRRSTTSSCGVASTIGTRPSCAGPRRPPGGGGPPGGRVSGAPEGTPRRPPPGGGGARLGGVYQPPPGGGESADPHPWATWPRHDAVIFQDHDFEVFIDPN